MNIVKFDDVVWMYNDLEIDVDYILNEIEDNDLYFWNYYTNGFNPDGTRAEGTIDGSALFLDQNNKFYQQILNVINECIIHYLKEHNEIIPLENLDINTIAESKLDDKRPLHIRKYFPGSVMSSHSDAILNYHNGGYTILFYFNENFEGGEIKFSDKNIVVKPKKASVLIFPENHEHEVLLVKEGVRYLTSAYLFRESKRNI